MLKIHGCWVQDRENTVWAPGQLTAPPVVGRIASSETWPQNALLDKDLLIVGYSTEWDYLNQMLAQTLGAVAPASVLVVDPSTTADFEAKAPNLAALAGLATKGAFHLQASGSDFLDELRLTFSKVFIRRAIAKGVAAYELSAGHPPGIRRASANLEAPECANLRGLRLLVGIPVAEKTSWRSGSPSQEGSKMADFLRLGHGVPNRYPGLYPAAYLAIILTAGRAWLGEPAIADVPPQPYTVQIENKRGTCYTDSRNDRSIDMQTDHSPARPPFGAWLTKQPPSDGLVGQLVAGAKADRRFPKNGDPEVVRKHLSAMQADGDLFEAVDEAEIDWLAY